MSRIIRRYHVYEVWEDGALVLNRIIEYQSEWTKAPYAVLDEDRDILSTYPTFADAWAAVRAEMASAPAAIETGPAAVKEERS